MAYTPVTNPSGMTFDQKVTAYQQAKQANATAEPFSQQESDSQSTMSALASDPSVVAAARANSNSGTASIQGNLSPPPASGAQQTDSAGTATPVSTDPSASTTAPTADSSGAGSSATSGGAVDPADLTGDPPQTSDAGASGDGSAPVSTASNDQGQTQSQPSSATKPSSDGGIAILCARGTTLLTNLGSNSALQTAGYYAIEEWLRWPLKDTVSGPAPVVITAPVLFTGVTVSERDVFNQTLCLNNVKVFYTFGQNFGDVTITGEILLGNFGAKLLASKTVKQFADFFWTYRVSNYNYPVHVSAVNEKYLVYLVGMDFGDIIPEVHIMPFVLHGVLLDVARNPNYTINPSSVVLSTSGLFDPSVIAALSATTSVDVLPGITPTPTTPSTPPAAGNAAVTGSTKPADLSQAPKAPNLSQEPDTGKDTTPAATLVSSGVQTPTSSAYAAAHDALVAGKAGVTQAAVDTLGAQVEQEYNFIP